MAKRKLLLLGVLLSSGGIAFAAPQTAAAPSGIKAYEEQEFIADFTKFQDWRHGAGAVSNARVHHQTVPVT